MGRWLQMMRQVIVVVEKGTGLVEAALSSFAFMIIDDGKF
jgi:hypothetical protein